MLNAKEQKVLQNTDKAIHQYKTTAYKGTSAPFYQKNIAGRANRTGYFTKELCECGVLPKVSLIDVCWDVRQESIYKKNLQGLTSERSNELNIQDNELRLAINNDSKTSLERFYELWRVLHLTSFIKLILFVLISLNFDGLKGLSNNIFIQIFGGFFVISRLLYALLSYFKSPAKVRGNIVIFNRLTGMVELANEKRSKYISLPFEEFNAHHSKGMFQNKAGNYGFAMMHYKENLTYLELKNHQDIVDALVHWELIKNFMDISQPLADIPEFERFRRYDLTTIEHDKHNQRPTNFWYRVNYKVVEKISKVSTETTLKFPVNQADTPNKAKLQGYTVPEIIKFPWKGVDNIAEEPLTLKPNLFFTKIYHFLFIVD